MLSGVQALSEIFQLQGEFIELNKLLKLTGFCGSGGEAKVRTSAGEVRVDGVVELRKRCKIRTGQQVEFAGHVIEVQ